MRWQITGTDADTGRIAELVVEEPEAAEAIRYAMARRIVVEKISGAGGWRRLAMPAVMVLFAAAVVAGAIFYVQNQSLRGELDQALGEQTRLAGSVAQAENLAAELRDHGNLTQDAADRVRKLADDLSDARGRMSLTQQELTAAQKHSDDLQMAAGRVPDLEKQVADLGVQLAQAQQQLKTNAEKATEMQAELSLQRKRMDDEQKLETGDAQEAAKAKELEKSNADLSAEIDKMKQDLLVATARLSATPASDPAADPADAPQAAPAAPAPARWAIRSNFDDANAFMLLHIDRDTLTSTGAADGLTATGGALPENAATMRVVHDRARERVYQVILSLSLAADAPHDKLAENQKFAADFVRTFAPAIKAPDELVNAASAQLAGQNGDRRLVFLAEDARITVWNNHEGLFTFRVDSSHSETQ